MCIRDSVAISGFEASLLVTLYLKQLGVKQVVVKAASDVHGRILESVGADTVVFPEKDMGQRLAYSLVSGSVIAVSYTHLDVYKRQKQASGVFPAWCC